jgi:DNA-binding response OmpR family regulator
MTAKARQPIAVTGHRGRVLVVEDEPDQQELLRYNLTREGYQVTCAEDGRQALAAVRNQPLELIVLDLMLPGMDGLEVCRTLRSDPTTASIPILMLTAKAEDSDVVAGLELGADDYVTKPYGPRILLAWIRAVLRTRAASSVTKPADQQAEAVIRHRNLVIMPERFEATVNDKPVQLSGTEFKMLVLLASKPGRVFTRAQIIRGVHGENAAVTDRSVDVHIFWLRQKLGVCGRWIEAVRGVGYRFRDVSGDS